MTSISTKSHGIMFHHFHDDFHEKCPGSLGSEEFIQMINWLNIKYNVIGAKEYLEKAKKGSLENKDICLTFDDALRCQYDIAVPILKETGLDAFFFIYSSVFTSAPDFLEIYRFFRTSYYNDINKFYDDFFLLVKKINKNSYEIHNKHFHEIKYLSDFKFYSKNDKWFRYLRDQFLDKKQYKSIMESLMDQKNFDIDYAKRKLWITENELRDIESMGHTIGLHSFSHPTQISKLNKKQQNLQYQMNYDHLKTILKKPIKSMSHPCGDYNSYTLNILSEIGIEIGFLRNMSNENGQSLLEIPREDHANIYREMKEEKNEIIY